MKYAIIDANNIVENVIVFELIDTVDVVESGKIVKSGFSMPGKLVVASDTAGIGNIYNPDTGEFIAGEEAAQRPLYVSREAAKLAVHKAIDEFTLSITGPVPADEKASWTAKEAAARAYVSGSPSPIQLALIKSEAEQTGETLNDLANKIIENANNYLLIVGTLVGIRRAKEAKIDAVTDDHYQFELIVAETADLLNGLAG